MATPFVPEIRTTKIASEGCWQIMDANIPPGVRQPTRPAFASLSSWDLYVQINLAYWAVSCFRSLRTRQNDYNIILEWTL